MFAFSTGVLAVWVFTASIAFAALPKATQLSEAQLSADRMRFDSQSGDFLATGNVTIQVEGLTVRAPRGTGNVKDKAVFFGEGIVALGDWQGEEIDLVAGSIELFFAQTPTYIAEGGVRGDIGKISIDADKFYMKGSDISLLNVRRLEDRQADIAFGAQRVQGTLLEGILTAMSARNDVWLTGRPNAKGEMVNIQGDTAVYSAERGSVVLSGSVRAVQKGRALTSRSLVYFPADNRIEAMGGIDLEGKRASPARITIDLNLKKRTGQKDRGQGKNP
jgi:lipopolysaccharide assembly outer membrane protein LptD (OstA)